MRSHILESLRFHSYLEGLRMKSQTALPTSRVPSEPPMSEVVWLDLMAEMTACSINLASSFNPRCSHIRDAVRIAPNGFAIFLPAMLGDEPCTGSNMAGPPGCTFAE